MQAEQAVQVMQHGRGAKARQFVLSARVLGLISRFAAMLGCATLLAACVSGTSADLACNNANVSAPLTGEIQGNVVVPRNATCYMQAHIAGDVYAHDGARVYVLDGTRITGSFRAIGAAVVRFNLDSAPVVATAATNRSPRGIAPAPKIIVGSNLIVKESKLIGESGIAATEIGGSLVIARNVDGGGILGPASFNVCTPGLCRPEAYVQVGKSVKIKQNHIAVAINNTSIGTDLKCSSNDRAPVLMKAQADAGAAHVSVKGRRSGQCEHLHEVVYGTPALKAQSEAPKSQG